MPYKVHKLNDDRRNSTCGFIIPNGGWYHIVDMTFENHQQLLNISAQPNYSVDHVESNVTGMFDPDGNQVDPLTVEINQATKLVTDYETVNKTRAGKEIPIKANPKGDEREEIISDAARMGIRIDNRWSTQRIKQEIENRTKRVDGSLAMG